MGMSAKRQRIVAASIAAVLMTTGIIGLYLLLQRTPAPLLERIQQTGVLLVATRNSPLSLIHISEPTRRNQSSRMPSSA